MSKCHVCLCKEEKELIFKSTSGSPACVKPDAVKKLIERGWGSFEIVGDVEKINKKLFCKVNNGQWRDEINECGYMSKELCAKIGGNYDDCGSACPPLKPGQLCTANCVPACKMN